MIETKQGGDAAPETSGEHRRKDQQGIMKVSKVVMIVVALHVLVIGGIFVFEGCSRTHVQSSDIATNGDQPATAPDAAVAPATDPLAAMAPATPGTPAVPSVTDAAATTPAPVAPVATTSYAVKKGDSLWKIAKGEGVSIDGLMHANNLTKTSQLKIGQKLTIPAKAEAAVATAAPAVTGATPVAAAPEASGASYAVKSGDSLWKIANKNGVSIASLKQANSLSSDKLKIGQKLTIPAKSAAASAATPSAAAPVQAGVATTAYGQWEEPGKSFTENGQTIHIIDYNESLGVIATKYGVSTPSLMKANNISDARNVHPGQRLVIPSASGTTTPSATAAPAAPVVQTTALAK
jgi:LysM repeat protein